MPPDPSRTLLFLNQLQITSAVKIRLKKSGNYAPPFIKFLTTLLLALIVGEKNLTIYFGPPPTQLRNASAIADKDRS